MTKDMTSGSPAKLIFGFAIPMFLGLLFQQFYSMVDTLIVGKFLGVNPLAGVGSTTSLNFMVLGFCMGVCNGFAIPVAQMFGAKEEHRLRRYVTNGAWLCIVFSIVMTLVVVAVCRPVLVLMQTPEEIFEYAYVYIVIVFWGIPCTFLYNILAAIIRSLGDSKTPVIFLAISSGINIVLDLVFVLVFDMGVEGPAIATVLAQGISGIICLWYMYRKFPVLHASRDEWKPELHYMGKLCYIGVPMGLQYSVTAIGTLVLQAAVNGLGAAVVAGVTAAQKINMFISCPIESLGQTMAPYAGQNMGAGNVKRVKQGFFSGTIISTVFALAVLPIFWGFAPQIISIFGKSPDVIAIGTVGLRIDSCFLAFLGLIYTTRNVLNGAGDAMFSLMTGIVEMCGRIFLARPLTMVPMFGRYGVFFATGLTWFLNGTISLVRYKRGKWKKLNVISKISEN